MFPRRLIFLFGLPARVGGLLFRELLPLELLIDGFSLTLAAGDLVVVRVDVDVPAHARSCDGND